MLKRYSHPSLPLSPQDRIAPCHLGVARIAHAAMLFTWHRPSIIQCTEGRSSSVCSGLYFDIPNTVSSLSPQPSPQHLRQASRASGPRKSNRTVHLDLVEPDHAAYPAFLVLLHCFPSALERAAIRIGAPVHRLLTSVHRGASARLSREFKHAWSRISCNPDHMQRLEGCCLGDMCVLCVCIQLFDTGLSILWRCCSSVI